MSGHASIPAAMSMKPKTPRYTPQAKPAADMSIDKAFIFKTEDGKNAAAVALGRMGGLKGGKARAEKLSPKRRKEIAKAAAYARWEKEK